MAPPTRRTSEAEGTLARGRELPGSPVCLPGDVVALRIGDLAVAKRLPPAGDVAAPLAAWNGFLPWRFERFCTVVHPSVTSDAPASAVFPPSGAHADPPSTLLTSSACAPPHARVDGLAGPAPQSDRERYVGVCPYSARSSAYVRSPTTRTAAL